jgi:hypothetical protein
MSRRPLAPNPGGVDYDFDAVAGDNHARPASSDRIFDI